MICTKHLHSQYSILHQSLRSYYQPNKVCTISKTKVIGLGRLWHDCIPKKPILLCEILRRREKEKKNQEKALGQEDMTKIK